jgi:CheY-like chemotaxis protein
MKLVVVDDEKDVQILFRQKFRKELKAGNVEMHFAFSAHEALQYVEGLENPEAYLVLSDINMPGMNGLDLLKELKQRFPGLKVFMITAYGDEQNYASAMQYGADDYFAKPIAFEQLKDRLAHVTSKNWRVQ